jgi:hypothetical protein
MRGEDLKNQAKALDCQRVVDGCIVAEHDGSARCNGHLLPFTRPNDESDLHGGRAGKVMKWWIEVDGGGGRTVATELSFLPTLWCHEVISNKGSGCSCTLGAAMRCFFSGTLAWSAVVRNCSTRNPSRAGPQAKLHFLTAAAGGSGCERD